MKALLYLLFAVAIISCSSHDEKETPHFHSLLDKIEYLENDTVNYDISSHELAEYIETVPVVQNQHDTLALVPTRKNKIQSFPCSNCHEVSLHELKQTVEQDKQKAHWDIELIHGDSAILQCNTCHGTENMDKLTTINDQLISYDQSHQLCAQCHSSEFKDWKGGAHGKKIGGWVPPKLIFTCVNCHNPHSPAFEKRWPARLNTYKMSKKKNEN